MFKIHIHLKNGDIHDNFHWKAKILPRKGDYFSCTDKSSIYEVDKVLLHLYDEKNNCDAEIFAHQVNK